MLAKPSEKIIKHIICKPLAEEMVLFPLIMGFSRLEGRWDITLWVET